MNTLRRVFAGPTDKASLSELLLLAGFAILAVPTSTLALASVGFLLGFPIGAWQGLLGLVAALPASWLLPRIDRMPSPTRISLVAAVLVAASLIAALVISGTFYDVSWDGQAYHQESVLRLAEGWNPCREELPAGIAYRQAMNHYAKGMEIVGAAVFGITGGVETGKAVNLLLIFTSFLFSWSALLRCHHLSAELARGIAFLAAANPVALLQALTFYNDGALCSLLTSLAALLAISLQRTSWTVLVAVPACIVLLVNSKFTGLVYAAILCAAFLLYVAVKLPHRALRRLAASTAVAFLLGVGVIGYHPYVRNQVRYGHAFYPLRGDSPADILSSNTPVELLRDSRAKRLLRSLFSRASRGVDEPVVWKIPFRVDLEELEAFGSPDPRISGFGPLFGGSLLLGIALLVIRYRDWAPASLPWLGLGTLLVSVMIHPAGWWARYDPQIWLLPVWAAGVALTATSPRIRISGVVLLTFLGVNAFALAGIHLMRNTISTSIINYQLEILRQASSVEVHLGQFQSVGRRLHEAGISYLEMPSPATFTHPMQFKIHASQAVVAIPEHTILPDRHWLLRRLLPFLGDKLDRQLTPSSSSITPRAPP
jgi:hypothetical protein